MPDQDRWLKYAALFYALGLALHTADHLRRGLDVVTPEVLWAGNVSTVIGLTAIVMVVVGHRRAPEFAAWTGIPVAIGVVAVHLLPHWSALSDSFIDASHTGVTAVSWTVVLIEIVGALTMGIVGIATVRKRGGVPVGAVRSAGGPRRTPT